MAAQVRILRAALAEHPEVGPLIDRIPFRLRRRRCSVGHRTWTVEIDREVVLMLLDRLDLDEVLP